MASTLSNALDKMGEELKSRPRPGSFSEEFLEEVRATDMTLVVEQYLQLPTGFSKMVNCPFHDDNSPSMRIYDDHAYCFACRWHGDQIKFVMEFEQVDFRQAVIRVAEIAGLPLEFASPDERQQLAERRREREDREQFLAVRRHLYGAVEPSMMREADNLKRRLPNPYASRLLVAMVELETRSVIFQHGHDGGAPEWMTRLDPPDGRCVDYIYLRRAFEALDELLVECTRLVELDGRKEDGTPGGVPVNHNPPPSKSAYLILHDIDYGPVPPWIIAEERERWERAHCVENWVTEDEKEQLTTEQPLILEDWVRRRKYLASWAILRASGGVSNPS